jgi:hypothetical protein
MLKVNDYCFKFYKPLNQKITQPCLSIYKVTENLDKTKMYVITVDTTSPNSLKGGVFGLQPRTLSYYTKCSSTTIEELKEEFPEVFI